MVLTDSATNAGELVSSFFCFGFALANELKRLLFSFFGAVFTVGLDCCWLFSFEGCWFKPAVSSGLGTSDLLCGAVSFCRGRLAGTVDLDDVVVEGSLDGGGGGRALVRLCTSSLSLEFPTKANPKAAHCIP